MRTEDRQVRTMFGVVILFIIGHFLRLLLNVCDLARVIRRYPELTESEAIPFWEIVIIS